MEPVDGLTARKTWRTLEPLHGMIYFVPEATEAYAALGITSNRMGYFASRAAPMGPVPAEVVIATFFNFNPALVRRSIPVAWSIATPAALVEARFQAAGAALRRGLGDLAGSDHVRTAADLARRAALEACQHPEGRPLFAGHAALPWPDDPLLVLWHAQSLLREFRGDAHIAALTLEGLSGIEALVTHAASGDVPSIALTTSRAWPESDWSAAVKALRERGLVEQGDSDTELSFTDAGRAHRQFVEDRTDQASAVAYSGIGDDGCAELRSAARDLSKAVLASGLLAVDPSRFTD